MSNIENDQSILDTVNRLKDILRDVPADEQPAKAAALFSRPIDPSLCFIGRLPPELLLHIFTYCKYFDTDSRRWPWWADVHMRDFNRPWPTVLALSHACRDWRHVTNSHGALWTEILVDNERWTDLYIERSRDAPLHLSFEPFADRRGWSGNVQSESYFDAALCTLDALGRVRELDICGPLNTEELSTLFTAGVEHALMVFNGDMVMIKPEDFICTPPSLRILSLKDFWTNSRMRLFHAPLTSLSLSRTYCGYPGPHIDERLVSPVVEILGRIPTLEHLVVTLSTNEDEDFHHLVDARGPHPTKASLPHLETLHVHDELPQALSLIESLTLPPNVKLSVVSEAWGEYDREEIIHESAWQIPSYDARLRDILHVQYAESSNQGARFTRLNIMDSQEAEINTSSVTIELLDPSTPQLPDSLLLTVDCEMYLQGSAPGVKALLRLIPSLPPVDGVRNLEIYVDTDEESWEGMRAPFASVTHLTVHLGEAFLSFLRTDAAGVEPLFPRLELITLDGCYAFTQWDEFREFLRRRGEPSKSNPIGTLVQWQALVADFPQTEEEERKLLLDMTYDGFMPVKWCRPRGFQYESSPKNVGTRWMLSGV
ncbi:unnamed protein product [Peniophora sp. CBMAI 1063]|nr:unnamed protein product [Peniophora sp. CBMAI 1063]